MSAHPTLVRSVLRRTISSAPRVLAAAGVLLLSVGGTAGAQSSSQVVRFRVVVHRAAEVAPVLKAISMLGAKGGVSTSALTLATNDASLKVTASIDQHMPAGTSLSLTVGDAASGRGTFIQRLGTDATDVLTGVSPTDTSRIPVSYGVAGTSDGGPRVAEQRLITYTFLEAP